MGRATDEALSQRQDGTTDVECGVCAELVDTSDDYLHVFCNKCTLFSLHTECAIEFLVIQAKTKCNSTAITKLITAARNRPASLFSQRYPCPNRCGDHGAGAAATVPGSRGSKAAAAAAPAACTGFTQGADVVKPVREPPPPLPQIAPPRGPKAAKKAPAAAAPAPKPKKPAAASAAAQPRLEGAVHAPWTAVGARKAAAAPSGSGLPPRHAGLRAPRDIPGYAAAEPASKSLSSTAPRAPEYRLCPSVAEMGECRLFNCRFSHSKEELHERERSWAAQREAKRREARLAAELAEAARLAREEDEAEALAQVESMRPDPSTPSAFPAAALPSAAVQAAHAAVHVSDASVHLIASFKHSFCLNSLLEMGFSVGAAQAAVEATGADLERAAQLLLAGDGGGGGGGVGSAVAIDVSREVGVLASAAAASGLDSAAVDAALQVAGGNWEAARESLTRGACGNGAAENQHQYQYGSNALSHSGDVLGEELRSQAPSQPDTPSLSGHHQQPPWAADALSTLSLEDCSATTGATAGGLPPAPPHLHHSGSFTALSSPHHHLASEAPPGVLSLADFSSDPGGGLGGLNLGLGSLLPSGVGVTAAEASDRALPAWLVQSGATPAPHQPDWMQPLAREPQPAVAEPLAAAAAAAQWGDGYAAGLAAAAAMQQQQYQQYSVDSAAAQPEGEEDLDDLLGMLGVN